MKKLTVVQMNNLKLLRDEGITDVYLIIRKHFGTSYVRIFKIETLIKDGFLPSYWYRGLGDCTENQAVKNGCVYLYNIISH